MGSHGSLVGQALSDIATAKLGGTCFKPGIYWIPEEGLELWANVAKAVKEAKAGKIEFRIDKQAIVHQAIGKVSFKPEDLRENAGAFLAAILKAKPSVAKGTYVKALSATTSMGPGIKIDAAATISAVSTGKK